MNQRLDRINGCHPVIVQPVLKMVELCERRLSRKLLVVHGFRSMQEQLLIYQKGRTYNREAQVWEVTDAKAVVTKSLPGSSAHNVVTTVGQPASMAVDVIPLLPDGQPEWTVNGHFWEQLYDIAWDLGLDPLGDPIGSYLAGDMGHFEEPAWKLKLDALGCYQPVAVTSVPAQV